MSGGAGECRNAAPADLQKNFHAIAKMHANRLRAFAFYAIITRQTRYALMVKRLRRRPLTAESGVRFPMRVPNKKGSTSVLLFCFFPQQGTKQKRQHICVAFLFFSSTGYQTKKAAHLCCIFCFFPQQGTKQKRQHICVAFFVFSLNRGTNEKTPIFRCLFMSSLKEVSNKQSVARSGVTRGGARDIAGEGRE